ncbi:MAG: FKBP-type peptidyl-prolyl cis-trans isomerase [Ilumatobacter sp.]|uniref:FKBP-type peptidyl-prolyl cis-trans isomerase n=1 Tax=Ilumatobacter sp. TaxID=1967498 RepID=UPI00260AFE8B|nr:FKBP-type peptidyl-prolyl cis-trans isomerase [Ilumatobacter sp.]MDJ0770911.1 FKBP-type peptidyl-prolyl cis-trans isomerase [Ilumatobacter sp.]
MPRPVLPLLVACTLAIAACGGDDEQDGAAATTDATDAADGTSTSSTATPSESAPATTTPSVTGTDPTACEAVPDAADYVDGQVPLALRPCDLPTELVVNTIRTGSGATAAAGDTVVVDYQGIRSIDGEPFDDSYSRGVPFDFPLGRGSVIQGWDQGLIGAQGGSLVKLDIPGDLAYGATPPPGVIQADDPLTFVIEVRAVIPSVTGDDAPLDLEVETSIDAVELTSYDVDVGDGPAAEVGSTVIMHLLLIRGDNRAVIFNTWELGDPVNVLVEDGQTIPGIFEGIQGAQPGTLRVITMPAELAFGTEGAPTLGLPGGTDVIAVADVVAVF